MKTTQEKIGKKEKELKELKEKLKKEQDISEWIYIPELKIEVQTKIHHKNKTYKKCENDLSKGESIPTYEQIQWLRNSKYKDQLNLVDTWEFVQNPDNISKENNYVARFCADSGYAGLDCNWGSDYSNSTLGVRFVRKKFQGVIIKMALTQIDFDEKEEKTIEVVSKKYSLNKPKAIKKIISEHKEEKGGN